MANENKDVLRVEVADASLASTIRERQNGYATDTYRIAHKFTGGTTKYYSADGEDYTSGSIVLPTGKHIEDTDGDTTYHLEQTSDDDTHRFAAGGTSVLTMDSEKAVMGVPISSAYGLWDTDEDTGIQVEEGDDDDDTVRIDAGGTEVLTATSALFTHKTDVTLAAGAQDYKFTSRNQGLSIQGQSTGQTSNIDLHSFDGNGTDDVALQLFGVGTSADITGYELVRLLFVGNATPADRYGVLETHADTVAGGTLPPLKLRTEGNTNQLVLATDGKVGLSKAPTLATLDVSGTVAVSSLAALGAPVSNVVTYDGDNVLKSRSLADLRSDIGLAASFTEDYLIIGDASGDAISATGLSWTGTLLDVVGSGSFSANLAATGYILASGDEIRDSGNAAAIVFDGSQNVALGTAAGAAGKLIVRHSGAPQLRLELDDTYDCDFQVDSGGYLVITPSGGGIELPDGVNLDFGGMTGSKIGESPGDKIGFWNATPVVQPSHIPDPAACAAMTFSHSWNGSTYPSAAEGNQVVADLAALKAAIDANNAAIDSINAMLATTGLTAVS